MSTPRSAICSRRGDSLLFVSDGVIEAQRGEYAFGMDRLKAEAVRLRQERGSVALDGVLAAVREFLGGEPPQDDMCLLTIDFLASDDPAQ